jgi:hypothetical protein
MNHRRLDLNDTAIEETLHHHGPMTVAGVAQKCGLPVKVVHLVEMALRSNPRLERDGDLWFLSALAAATMPKQKDRLNLRKFKIELDPNLQNRILDLAIIDQCTPAEKPIDDGPPGPLKMSSFNKAMQEVFADYRISGYVNHESLPVWAKTHYRERYWRYMRAIHAPVYKPHKNPELRRRKKLADYSTEELFAELARRDDGRKQLLAVKSEKTVIHSTVVTHTEVQNTEVKVVRPPAKRIALIGCPPSWWTAVRNCDVVKHFSRERKLEVEYMPIEHHDRHTIRTGTTHIAYLKTLSRGEVATLRRLPDGDLHQVSRQRDIITLIETLMNEA